jgi:hypothetical protein
MLQAVASETTNIAYLDDLPYYAEDKESASIKAAVNVLKGMFPTVTDIPNDTRALGIVERSLSHMMHFDQKFDTNAQFGNDHYELMVMQAEAHTAWLDSPDGTPIPDILLYRPVEAVVEGDEVTETLVASVETATVTEPVEVKERKPRGPANDSNYQKALRFYKEDVAAGKIKSHTVARMVALGIAPGTAGVYYSKFKHAKS